MKKRNRYIDVEYSNHGQSPQLAQLPSRSFAGLNSRACACAATDFYDERAARQHVRRLREILVDPPAHLMPESQNLYSATGSASFVPSDAAGALVRYLLAALLSLLRVFLTCTSLC